MIDDVWANLSKTLLLTAMGAWTQEWCRRCSWHGVDPRDEKQITEVNPHYTQTYLSIWSFWSTKRDFSYSGLTADKVSNVEGWPAIQWLIRSGCTAVTKPSNISSWLELSSSFLKPCPCLFLPYWFSQQTLLWIYSWLDMALEDAVSYEDWCGSLFLEETSVGFLVVIPRVAVSNCRVPWGKIHGWGSSDLNYLMRTLGFFWVGIPHLKS